MPKVKFIDYSGKETIIEGNEGDTVMSLAYDNDVDGIDANCGGGCACATCHCYVEPEWTDKVGGPDEAEDSMLEMAACEKKSNSRLSCQIIMSAELDGLTVRLPEEQ